MSANVNLLRFPQKLPGTGRNGTRKDVLSMSSNRPNNGFTFSTDLDIGDQLLIRQAASLHACHVSPDGCNAAIFTRRVKRWQAFCVLLKRKLIHVAGQVFFAPM